VPENLSIYILDTVPKRSNRPKKTISVPTLLFRKYSRKYATTIVVDMTHLMVVRTT